MSWIGYLLLGDQPGGRLPGTGTYSGNHVCSIIRTGLALPAAAVESAPVVESATIVVPATIVVLAAVVLVVVLAFLILTAVVVALVVFVLAIVSVAAKEPVAAEEVAQRFGRQDAAADAEGDLACPGQEALAA